MNIRDMVQIPISSIDLSKADNKVLLLLVVEKKIQLKIPLSWKLANYLFQIENLHKGSYISIIKDVNPKLLYLDKVIDIY